jgi:xanthine dehydrogenase accessory factor
VSVLHEIAKALSSGERVGVATIISTSGSTPASAFSKMLVLPDGTTTLGTVGGGCVEADVVKAARACLAAGRAEILKFHLSEDEYILGLICGGTVEVLVEPITGEHAALFQSIERVQSEGTDSVLRTLIAADGRVNSKSLILSPSDVGEEESEVYSTVVARHETRVVQMGVEKLILEPIAGMPRLIIFGAGHVSRAICKTAAAVDFSVTIVDDREQYANAERFPEAMLLLVREFDEVVSDLGIRSSDYLIITTRGHRYDEEILERVVNSKAKYIGMIGSQRKVLTTYKHLVALGISVDALARVCSPMGLEIGSTTPEEIAVSVVAEMVAVRRNRFDRKNSKSSHIRLLLEQHRSSEARPPVPKARNVKG